MNSAHCRHRSLAGNLARLLLGLLPPSMLVAGGRPLAAAPAQPPIQPPIVAPVRRPTVNYAVREQTAPPAIRNLLNQMRQEIAAGGLQFSVGYTTALDFKLEQITGARPPEDITVRSLQQNALAMQLRKVDLATRAEAAKHIRLPELQIQCSANARTWDWRRLGKVTPIRNQSPCGTCWDFGSLAALESSYAIRNNQIIDASEQQILACAVGNDGNDAGKCPFPPGGWHAPVFEYLVSTGTARDSDYLYTGADSPCNADVALPYRAVAWGYVTTEVSPGFESIRIPTVAEMKQALCEYGPLAVAVLATSQFQAYTGGADGNDVFKQNLSDATLHPVNGATNKKRNSINHLITLIGWDDNKNAWLIKNSWGTGWGGTGGFGTEGGYMWIDYNTNNIGFGAAWVQAQNRFYKLPQEYYKLHRVPIKPLPDPGPLTPGIIRPLPRSTSPRTRIPALPRLRIPAQ